MAAKALDLDDLTAAKIEDCEQPILTFNKRYDRL